MTRAGIALALLVAGTACRIERARTPPPVATEGRVVTPDGVSLYYRVAGAGTETVIAPFALFHETALDELATGRRIVTYDPRGRGRSDAVPPGKVSLEHLLIDLETVRQAVGAERVALIGWSGGGMEMFVYALRHPERVTRLVQLAPVAPRFEPYGAQMMADRARRTDSAALAVVERRIQGGEFRADPARACRTLAAVTGPALFADPAQPPATPDVCRFENEHPQQLAIYFGALFQSIDGFDWRDSLVAVIIPRLVIHGARDNTPLAGNEEWVAGVPNARLLVLEGAGHWPHYERPDVTLSAIASFLGGAWPADAGTLPAR